MDTTIKTTERTGPRPGDYIEEDHGHTTPCWQWQKSCDKGYPVLWMSRSSGRRLSAAKYYYTDVAGYTIPEGHNLRRACSNKLCVNPDHMLPVDNRPSVKSSNLKRIEALQVRLVKEQELTEDLKSQLRAARATIADLRKNGLPPRPKWDGPMHIYFLQKGEDGPIKIGRSRNPERRCTNLQVYNPDPLHLIKAAPATAELEQELHKKFCANHVRGEWFTPTPELLSYIAAL